MSVRGRIDPRWVRRAGFPPEEPPEPPGAPEPSHPEPLELPPGGAEVLAALRRQLSPQSQREEPDRPPPKRSLLDDPENIAQMKARMRERAEQILGPAALAKRRAEAAAKRKG